MIKSFACKDTEKLFHREKAKKFPPDIHRRAFLTLLYLDQADSLQSLMSPPALRLEKLKGKQKHLHSIRINLQWRICFKWVDGNAYLVEIVDYH